MKIQTRTKKELVSTKIIIGDDEVNVNGYVHFYVDINYGSDADGNRGERHTFIDDVTDVGAYLFDGEEIRLDEIGMDRAISALTTKFLES